ncbi:MAG: zf-HC2 domain-containing protein [Pyrinomonadaceae bacterium]
MALKLYDKLKHAVRFWLLRRLPTCQNTVETISQSMERPLTLRERITVKLHLWICAWCQWYLEQLQLIRDAARAKASESHDLNTASGLSAEARERIKRNLTSK